MEESVRFAIETLTAELANAIETFVFVTQINIAATFSLVPTGAAAKVGKMNA